MMTGLKMSASKGVGEIWLYDVIGDGFFGGINGSQFVRELAQLGNVDEIVAHINSPGGMCSEGTAIYNSLKAHKAKVTVEIEGGALSIASLIAMAGDKIRIAANAMLMIHEPAMFTWGMAAEHRKSAEYLEKVATITSQTYADRAGKSLEKVREWMAAETWWTADEAKADGLVDEVVPNKTRPGDASKDASQWDSRVLQSFRNRPAQWSMTMLALPAEPPPKPPKESVMDLAKLKAEHPGLVAQIEKEASEKTLSELTSKDDVAKQKAAVEKAAKDATASEAKRQSDIRALCDKAKCVDKADAFCADVSITVADVQGKLFEAMCKNNTPPTGGNDDTPGTKDPDAAYKKEFAEQRVTLLQLGVSEEEYVNTRRRDDGKEPLAPKKSA